MIFHYYTIILILCFQWFFCLFSGDISLSLSASFSCSFVTVLELFFYEVFEIFIILLAILWAFNSPVASAVFWITFFEEVLSASLADCLAWSRSYIFHLSFTYIFTNIITHTFSKRQRSIAFYQYSISLLNWIAHRFLYFTL